MEQTDRDKLKGFLDELSALIRDVLDERHEDWFPPRLRERLRQTWHTEMSVYIQDIKRAIDRGEGETALETAGLTGEQLRIKLDAWDEAWKAAQAGPLNTTPRRWRQSFLGWIGDVLRPLQGALKIANAILESIGTGIPLAHAVEEFKKILEGLLDLYDGRGPIKKFGAWLRRRSR